MQKFTLFLLFFFFVFFLTSLGFSERLVVISDIPAKNTTIMNSDFQSKVAYNPNYLKNNLAVSKKHSIMSVSDEEFYRLSKRKDISLKTLEFNPESIELFQTVSMPSVFANYAWNLGVTGSGAQVGIIDTGIDENSLPFIGKVTAGRNFCSTPANDDFFCYHWHGCAVGSIAAGQADDLNGVAKDANIIAARVFNASAVWCAGSDPWPFFSWTVDSGARIINNSWGTAYDILDPDGNNNALIWDTFDINFLDSNTETLLVFSAGNDGDEGDTSTISNDCSAYNILCVAGYYDNDTESRADDILYSSSSRGPTTDLRKKPDITAPGQSILSYVANDAQGTWSGTSASSPHVSGALALLQQIDVNGLNAKAVLLNSADDVNSESWDKYTGWGYLNIQNALDWNAFVTQNFISDSILTPIDNNLQTSFIYPTYADFYVANSDTNLKCTTAWRRIFDVNDDSFVQNFDLFANVGGTTDSSESAIDNVEQVFIDANGSTKIKVYLGTGGVDSSDINYALACNVDTNALTTDPIDYYVSIDDTNYYTSVEDGNFSLLFNFDKNTVAEEDINFDINVAYELNDGTTVLSATDSFTDKNNNTTFTLDFNYNFASLSDYNLIVDYNIVSSDYNHTVIGQDSVFFSTASLDSTDPVLDTNLDNAYYLIDENIDENLIFTDTHIFSVTLTDNNAIDYTWNITDGNTITYNLDFNIVNYDAFERYDFNFVGRDVFGNTVDKNVGVYYKPVFSGDLNLDLDSEVLTVDADANDVNIAFTFSPDYNYILYSVTYDNYAGFLGCDINSVPYAQSYWYLCYDSNNELVDVNDFNFTNASGTIYYDLLLDNNYLIAIKEQERDAFLTDLNIVFESSTLDPDTPDSLGGGGGGGSNGGFEFKVESSSSDGKYYVGKEITITLKEDDSISIIPNVDVNITYPNSKTVVEKTDSSGNIKFTPVASGDYTFTYKPKTKKYSVTITVLSSDLIPKETTEETIVQEKGSVEVKTFEKFFIVYLFDDAGKPILSGIAKIVVDSNEITLPIYNGSITLDNSLSEKEVALSVVNKNGGLILDKLLLLPTLQKKQPDLNIDTNSIQIMNPDQNKDLENSGFNVKFVFWIVGIVVAVLVGAFLVWKLY